MFEFPDDMSTDDIAYQIDNEIIPNADMDNPDPEAVKANPDLFPNIDRGSWGSGIGSALDRLSRVPEAYGASVGGSQEDLDAIKEQTAAEGEDHKYLASFDESYDLFKEGKYLDAAGTFFGDYLAQKAGESLPDLAIMGAGSILGGIAGSALGPAGTVAGVTAGRAAGSMLGRRIGQALGGIGAGYPSFVGQHTERDIQANDITDPDDINTLGGHTSAVAASALEYVLWPLMRMVPGIGSMERGTVLEMVEAGAKALTTKEGAKMLGTAATLAGVEEALTEPAQTALERLQAGLPISLDDEEAVGEYIESAITGGALGFMMGGGVGTYGVYKTKKAIPKMYEAREQLRADLIERQTLAERERAIETGMLPDPDVPLLTTRIKQEELTPHEGSADENVTEEVNNRVNRSDEKFIDDRDARLFDDALNESRGSQSIKQAATASILKTAQESLHTQDFSVDETDAIGAPALSKAVMEREAGRGDHTVEQTRFTIEELEEAGKVTGLDPNEIQNELQVLRRKRRPETERVNNTTPMDVINAAKAKNVRTGTKNFNALVKALTKSKTLEDADPFRLTLLKEVFDSMEAFTEPRDFMDNIREENYSPQDFRDAFKFAAQTPRRQPVRGIDKQRAAAGHPPLPPVFSVAKFNKEFDHIKPKDRKALVEELERSGIIRRANINEGGKGHVATHEMIDPTVIASDDPIAAPDPIVKAGRDIDYKVRPTPSGQYVVVAEQTNAAMPVIEAVSVHDTEEKANLSAYKYKRGATSIDAQGRETQRAKPKSGELTGAQLREQSATGDEVETYKRWRDAMMLAGLHTDGQVMQDFLAELNNLPSQKALQKAGVDLKIQQTIRGRVEQASQDAQQRYEGDWNPVDEVITLAMDTAVIGIEGPIAPDIFNQMVMDNLKGVLSHEQIHALRKLGILKEGDFRILTRYVNTKVRPDGVNRFANSPGITEGMTYMDQARVVYADQVLELQNELRGEGKSASEITNTIDDFLAEEAVAEAFRDWASDKSAVTGKPASLFQRIVNFIKTLGGFLHDSGARQAEDIFDLIEAGEMGPRTTRAPPETAAPLSSLAPTAAAKEDSVASRIGNYDYIAKNHPAQHAATEAQITKEAPAEQKRIRQNLKQHSGTPWSLATIRGLVIREAFDRLINGQSIDDIATGTFWSAANKIDLRNEKMFKAFKAGPEGVKAFAGSYNFFGKNRKAEQDFSGSFINCDPSKACAMYCYSAGGTGGSFNGIAKGEFTEYMAKNHQDQLVDRLTSYKGMAAGMAGLALRMNEKGDLSTAQVDLVDRLNKEGMRIQIFSKRPELLRIVNDMNWRSLSIDGTNAHVADANPDLNVAVIVTEDFPATIMDKVKDRLNVVLPVNLKGQSWSRDKVLKMFPNSAKEVGNKLCPVDGGSKKTVPGTSFSTAITGLKKGGKGPHAWTCTACDLLGAAGCFQGKNKTTTQKKASKQFEAKNLEPKQDINKVRKEVERRLQAMVNEETIDAGQLADVLRAFDGKPEASRIELNPPTAESSLVQHDGGSEQDESSGDPVGRADRSRKSVAPDTQDDVLRAHEDARPAARRMGNSEDQSVIEQWSTIVTAATDWDTDVVHDGTVEHTRAIQYDKQYRGDRGALELEIVARELALRELAIDRQDKLSRILRDHNVSWADDADANAEAFTLQTEEERLAELAEKYSTEGESGGGEFVMGMDKVRLLDMMGIKMYDKPLATVAVKELMQNAYDAVKSLQQRNGETEESSPPRNVNFIVDPTKRTITIMDDGIGMTPETLITAFFTVAGTHKAHLPPHMRSGGLGVAKMGFLLGSHDIRVSTVHEGVETRAYVTSDQLLDSMQPAGAVPLKYNWKKTDKLNGSIMTITIPESYTDSWGGEQKIAFPEESTHAAFAALNVPLLGNLNVSFENLDAPKKTAHVFEHVGANFDVGSVKEPTTIRFPWGDIDILLGKKKKKTDYHTDRLSWDNNLGPRHVVLSAGIHQFEHEIMVGEKQYLPHDIVFNVKPSVDARSEVYPFYLTRERFSDDVDSSMQVVKQYLLAVSNTQALDTLADTFKTMEYISPSRSEGRVLTDDMFESAIQRQVEKVAKVLVFDGQDLLAEDGSKVFEGSDEIASKDDQYIDSSELNLNLPILHTDMVWDDYYDTERHEKDVDVIAELGLRTNKTQDEIRGWLSDLGDTFIHLRNTVAEFDPPEELRKLGFYRFHDLEQRAVGVSVSQDYLGVNINLPIRGMFINPAVMTAWGQKHPRQQAHTMFDTMVHEIIHEEVRNHSESFTVKEAQLTSSIYGIELEGAFADQYYTARLQALIERDPDIFRALQEMGNDDNIKNRETRLENYGHGSSTGGVPSNATPQQIEDGKRERSGSRVHERLSRHLGPDRSSGDETGPSGSHDQLGEALLAKLNKGHPRNRQSIAPTIDPMGFHNKAYEMVMNFKEESGTGKMWWKQLNDNVSDEELDTIVGLKEMLDSVDGRINKDDMAKFIKQNGVMLNEIVLDKASDPQAAVLHITSDEVVEPNYENEINYEIIDNREHLEALAMDAYDIFNPEDVTDEMIREQATSYVQSNYQDQPYSERDRRITAENVDGDQYEVIGSDDNGFTINAMSHDHLSDWLGDHNFDEPSDAVRAIEGVLEGRQAGTPVFTGGDYNLDGGVNHREFYITLPRQALGEGHGNNKIEDWLVPSGHGIGNWEADNRKVVRIRVDDRIVNGKRVLYVDEIQGDRQKQGNKFGWAGSQDPQAVRERFKDWLHENYGIGDGPITTMILEDPDAHSSYWVDFRREDQYGTHPIPWAGNNEYAALAMKRIIYRAVDEGYDSVAWSPAEVQLQRYPGLRYKLNEVLVGKSRVDNTYTISGFSTTQGETLNKTNVKPEEIAKLIGSKDLADKIIREVKEGAITRYDGLDLTVGGGGMKQFYGDIPTWRKNKGQLGTIGSIAKKIAGKNAKVGEIAVPTGYRPDSETIDVWNLPLTDKLANKVKTEGFSRFSVAPPIGRADWKVWWKKSKVVDEAGNPLPVFRGLRRVPPEGKVRERRSFRANDSYAPSAEVASIYTSSATSNSAYYPEGSHVQQAFLSIQNPLDWTPNRFNDVDGAYISLGQVFGDLKLDATTEKGRAAISEIFEALHFANGSGQLPFSVTGMSGPYKGLSDITEVIEVWDDAVYDAEAGIADEDVTDFNLYAAFDGAFVDTFVLGDLPEIKKHAVALGYDGIKHMDVMEAVMERSQHLFNKPLDQVDGVSVEHGEHIYETWRPFNDDQAKSPFNPDYGKKNKFSHAPGGTLRPTVTSGYEQLTETDKTIWDRAQTWLKKEFTSAGLLDEDAFALKLDRDNQFNLIEVDIPVLTKELDRALKEAFGTTWSGLSEPHKKQINELAIGSTTSTLPQPVKRAVFAMRQYIDKGSGEYASILREQSATALAEATRTGDQEQIKIFQARENLIKIITGNMEKYLHRSYKVFDDPEWHKKISRDVYDRAHKYLMSQEGYNDPTDADRTINDIVKKGTAYNNIESMIKEGILGAKDLTALKKRNNELAPEIRELMGEYDDLRVNFAKTATKVGRLIWNQRFLDNLLSVGKGVFLFEEGKHPPNATETISAAKSDIMSPLNGMRVTPETLQAFRDALDKSDAHNWERQIFAWNGAVKYGKTILSPATQFRNVVSAYMFTVANGHFDMSHMKKSKDTMMEYIKTKNGGTREYYREMVELGVTYNNPQARALIDLLEDARENQFIDKFFSGDGNLSTLVREGSKVLQRMYMAGDDFWKIIGFENELALYMKAKGMTRAQASPIVAKRIRDTYPTYALVGAMMKRLRKFPLAGTFVSFPSEIIRTTYHQIKYIQADLKDPDLRGLAKRRMLGMAIAHSWAGATAALTASLFGMSDDEEEAVRLMGSPWAENSSFLFWGRDEKGNLRMQDLSYTDPYNILHRPFVSLFRDQDPGDKAVGALKDFLSPFIGTDIASGAIYEVMKNEKSSGGRVFNPAETPMNQLGDISSHFAAAVAPGAILQVGRMAKAIKGVKSPSGRVYNVDDEALGMVGLRISTFDPNLSLYYRTFQFGDSLANARRILADTAKTVNPVSEEELRSSFDVANDARIDAYKEMMKFVNGARDSGLTNGKIRKILRASGISTQYTNHLVRGKDAPKWRIRNTFLKGAVKRARILVDRETAQELRKRKRAVRHIAREMQSQ